jgi:hypothetical protein
MHGRLDGAMPTALEGLEQRRATARRLQEIDELLRSDPDGGTTALPVAAARSACSFGSGRAPTRTAIYWLSKSSSAPGPGAYAASKADSLVKPHRGGGGALGLRSTVCCRFQPCECKQKQRCEVEETASSETEELRQDSKQPRRLSPSLVAYPRPARTEPDFQTRELRRRVTEVQAAKQRWRARGLSTTPNYRWMERRAGAGGALQMDRSTSRDGSGNAAAQVRLRMRLIADRPVRKGEAEAARIATSTASATAEAKAAVDMKRLPGRDRVRCRRKNQRVVTAFGS